MKKDKAVAWVGGLSMLAFYLASFAVSDIPSWQHDELSGVPYMLDRLATYYLPLFPFVAGIVGCFLNKMTSALSFAIVNGIMTSVCFFLALWCGFLALTWLCLLMCSGVFVLIAKCDEDNQKKNNNDQLPF